MDLLYENWMKWLSATFIGIAVIANYHEFKVLASARDVPFKFLLLAIINLLFMPFFYLSIPIFGLYHFIIDKILSVRHGPKYGGMLCGADAIVHLQNIFPIQAVFLINYENNSSKPFFDFVKDTLRKAFLAKFKQDAKVFGTIQKNFGYFYILKDEVDFEYCFTKVERIKSDTEELTKADFSKLLTDNVQMPKNYKALWEISVGSQPVKWKTNQDESIKFYPVLVKVHHVMGDGLHLLKAFMELFADVETVETDNNNSVKSFLDNLKQANNEKKKRKSGTNLCLISDLFGKAKTAIKYLFLQCYIVMVVPTVTFVTGMLTRIEPNLLQGPELLHDIFRCVSVEESPRYMRTVKRIKRKIPGATFEDIFVVAFTASLAEFYQKNSAPIPDYLICPTSLAPDIEELVNFLLSDVRSGNTECINTVLIRLRKLPTAAVVEGTITSLIKGLEIMKKERRYLGESVEVQVTKFMRNVIVRIVPEPILMMFMKEIDNFACFISNIPGPPYPIKIRGCEVESMIPLTANLKRTGTALMISSYDDRIQIAFSIDKALISRLDEAQEIVDNIYKYIDILDKGPIPESNGSSVH